MANDPLIAGLRHVAAGSGGVLAEQNPPEFLETDRRIIEGDQDGLSLSDGEGEGGCSGHTRS